MEVLLAVGVFAASMSAMAVGVILSDRTLKGSCGGVEHRGPGGELLSCGGCAKQQAELCPSDDPLVKLAQIGHPDPRHHH